MEAMMDVEMEVKGNRARIANSTHVLHLYALGNNAVEIALKDKKRNGLKNYSFTFSTPRQYPLGVQLFGAGTVKEAFKELCKLSNLLNDSGAFELLGYAVCALSQIL
jgi:hypothetical protein